MANRWKDPTYSKAANIRAIAANNRCFGARDIIAFWPNAKVSDGSQPPSEPASPLGVPAGARSLDRLVGLPMRSI